MVTNRLTADEARQILDSMNLRDDEPLTFLSQSCMERLAKAAMEHHYQKRGVGKYSRENIIGFYHYLIRLAKPPKLLTPSEAKRREERRSTRVH